MELAERRRRARERHADVAREAILNAGQDAFARLGFSGARVDEIAKASGYNKALLFHYFGDKLGLYQAVMGRMKERILEHLGGTIERFALASDETPTREQVVNFVTESFRWVFDYYGAHPQTARILAWEAAEGWQTFTACAPIGRDSPWTIRVRAFLQRAQAAGVLRRQLDPTMLLATVMSLPLIHLVSVPRYEAQFADTDFHSPAALEHAREQMLELVLHGTLTTPEEA
jgi:AcrR family transcriptional regulator